MTPNKEQIGSIVRWLITIVGGIIASSGILGSAGEGVLAILNSEFFIGLAVSAISLLWGLFAHTAASNVATVAALNETKVSPDGRTITLLQQKLVEVAKAAATPAA